MDDNKLSVPENNENLEIQENERRLLELRKKILSFEILELNPAVKPRGDIFLTCDS